MSKVYAWFGHGKDICDPVTKRVKRVPVPEGVTFMQTGLCGLVTVSSSAERFRPFENPENLELLRRANPTELRSVFGSISRHSLFDPHPYAYTIAEGSAMLISAWVDGNIITIHSSGIQEIPFKGPRPPIIKWDLVKQGILPISELKKMFVNSVYPPPELIDDLARQCQSVVVWGGIKSAGDLYLLMRIPGFRVNVVDMLKKLKGVHYHTICRSTDEDCIDDAIATRPLSAKTHQRDPEDVRNYIFEHILVGLENGNDLTSYQKEINALSFEDFTNFVIKLSWYPPLQHLTTHKPLVLDLVKKRMKESGDDPTKYRHLYFTGFVHANKGPHTKAEPLYADFNAYVESLKAGSGRRTRRRRGKKTRKHRIKF